MEKNNLSTAIWFSVLAHFFLAAALIFKVVFFPEHIEDYQAALRVDIVDLPDKLPESFSQNEPPQPEEPLASNPEKKVEPLPEKKNEGPEVVLNEKDQKSKDKNKLQDAVNDLKRKMAIDRIKNSMLAQNKDSLRQELNRKVVEYKGNVLASGTELVGINKIQHNSYLTDLDRHVKKFWRLPEWLARQNYSARIKVYINGQGSLMGAKMIQASGNSDYDEMVLSAVKKADPFPAPPEKFKAIVSEDGMLLGFPE